MCGRYYVDDSTIREIEKIVRETDTKLSRQKEGDVYPSQQALILTGKKTGFGAEGMKWGFPQYDRKGLLINARAETAMERKSFRDSLMHRRCIIPAKHFYEWDSSKNKVTFLMPEKPVIYMAGFYRHFQEGDCFIIITTQANASVNKVHERMPLILEDKELVDWVYDDFCFQSLLQKTPPLIQQYREYEQQSFF